MCTQTFCRFFVFENFLRTVQGESPIVWLQKTDIYVYILKNVLSHIHCAFHSFTVGLSELIYIYKSMYLYGTIYILIWIFVISYLFACSKCVHSYRVFSPQFCGSKYIEDPDPEIGLNLNPDRGPTTDPDSSLFSFHTVAISIIFKQ